MYRPKATFWGFLTAEGRLKNQWAHGLDDTDLTRGQGQLRLVQQKLTASPAQFSRLWSPFLDTYLERSRLGLLTDADLVAVGQMGDAIARLPGASIKSEDLWFRVVEARDARKEERQAIEMLAHIYGEPSAGPEVKARCARDLARRGATGDGQVRIYIDHLQRFADAAADAELIKLLTGVCAVGFGSDPGKLRRAGETARQLAGTRIRIPGLRKAQGFYELLISQAPAKAISHFEAAAAEQPDDRQVVVAILVCHLKTGDYEKAIKAGRDAGRDPAIEGLMTLATVLKWLGDPGLEGPVPCSAADLSGYQIGTLVGDILPGTVAILGLLEGFWKPAKEMLPALADRQPEHPLWGYYAAWAGVLSGDHDLLAWCFKVVGKRDGRWAVAALLIDLDQELAMQLDAVSQLLNAPAAFAGIVACRRAMAGGRRPEKVSWTYSPQVAPGENLEALRTALGFSIYADDLEEARKLAGSAAFLRLPLADQLLWQGLVAKLSGDGPRSRNLIEKAAVALAYPRAAKVLTVALLEQGKISEAREILSQAAWIKDDRTELLRSYVEACEGKADAAAVRLDRLVARGNPRVYYALGRLFLRQADEARVSGNAERARLFIQQAAGAFRKALSTENAVLPGDCRVLAACTGFLANPTAKVEGCPELWAEVERLDPGLGSPWLIWNAFLMQLWWGTPASIKSAGEKAFHLQEALDRLDDSALATVASAIARACGKADTASQADLLVMLLAYMSTARKQQIVMPYYRLGVAAAARRSYLQLRFIAADQAAQKIESLAAADPGNGALALVAAQVCLANKSPESAGAVLSMARPEGLFERDLTAALAGLLAGNPAATLPQPLTGAPPDVVQACHLLKAASAFASGRQDEGYKAILDALRYQKKDIAPIIRISRILPSLCMHSGRGVSAPQQLQEEIRALSLAPATDEERAVIARCAAAIGDVGTACKVWSGLLERAPRHPSVKEYAAYLTHLAAASYTSGNPREAVDLLRLAATAGGR